jgi:hypothetical protein
LRLFQDTGEPFEERFAVFVIEEDLSSFYSPEDPTHLKGFLLLFPFSFLMKSLLLHGFHLGMGYSSLTRKNRRLFIQINPVYNRQLIPVPNLHNEPAFKT